MDKNTILLEKYKYDELMRFKWNVEHGKIVVRLYDGCLRDYAYYTENEAIKILSERINKLKKRNEVLEKVNESLESTIEYTNKSGIVIRDKKQSFFKRLFKW